MKKIKRAKVAFPPLGESFYTSVAKNVQPGNLVTVRNKKVVRYNSRRKPTMIGVWTEAQSIVLILPDGKQQALEIPGGFQIRGLARVQAKPDVESYYGIPIKWDKTLRG